MRHRRIKHQAEAMDHRLEGPVEGAGMMVQSVVDDGI